MYQQMTAIDKRVLLQSLLIDRFGLKYHHELKPLHVYELVSAKPGTKLKDSLSGHFALSVGRGHLEAKVGIGKPLVHNQKVGPRPR